MLIILLPSESIDGEKEKIEKVREAARNVLLRHLQNNSRISYEPKLASIFLDRRIKEYLNRLRKK